MYNGALGRIRSLPLVLANPKFTSYTITIRVIHEYYDMLKELCKGFSNVDVIDMEYVEESTGSIHQEEMMSHQHHNTSEDDA